MEWVKLGDVFLFIRNGKNIKQFGDEGYPITRIETIANRNIDEKKVGYASIFDLEKYKDYLLKKGDILMSHINSEKHLGKTAIFESDSTIIHGMNLLMLRPNIEIVLPMFVYYALNSEIFLKQIPKITKNSVNQSSFTVSNLKTLRIPVTSIPTQQKIVQILDEAQSLIDSRKRQIELLDKLIESVFYDMFGDPVKNEKGWEVDKLKNNINLLGGYAFKSNEYKDKGVPVIKIGNINRGYFEDKNLQFYDEQKSLERYLLKSGDLVMSLTGTVGKDDYGNVCILGDEYDKYYLNQRNTKIDVLNKLDKIYLKYIFKDNGVRANLTKANRGVRQANISNDDIYGLIIPIPPLSFQNQFALKVESIEKQKQLLQDSLNIMQNNYNMLMQRAFNGELFN